MNFVRGTVLIGLLLVACGRDGASRSAPDGASPPAPGVVPASCEPAAAPTGGWAPLGAGPQGMGLLVTHPRHRDLLFALSQRLWRSTDGGRRFCPVDLPGTVHRIAVAPSAPAVAYVVVDRADKLEILRSADGGHTWTPRTLPEPGGSTGGLGTGELLVHPTDPDTLYAATLRDPAVGFSDESPLYRSVDGARSWGTVGPKLPVRCRGLSVALIDPADPDRLYVHGMFDTGAIRGAVAVDAPILLRYRAGAAVWEVVRRGGVAGAERWAHIAAIDQRSRLYAYGSPEDFMRSDDSGATWMRLPRAPGLGPLRRLAAEALPPGDLFALAVGQDESASLVQSADGGATWRPLAGTGPGPSFRHEWLAVSGSAPRALHVGALLGPMRSTDDGRTFARMFLDLADAVALTVARSDPSVIYLVSNQRLLRSADEGATWTEHPYPGRSIVVHPGNADVLWSAGRAGEAVYRSDDGGKSWSRWWPTQAKQIVVADVASQVLWVLVHDRLLASSRDGGRSWTSREIVWPGKNDDLDLTDLLAAPSDPETGYLATGSGALAATSDGWTTVTVHEAPPGLIGLAVQPADARVLVGWTEEGVHRSTDGGRTWTDARTRFPFEGSAIERRVLFDPWRPEVVYALGRAKAWRSRDGGASWQPLGVRGLPERAPLTSLTPDPRSPATLYLPAWTFGVFKTKTAGD